MEEGRLLRIALEGRPIGKRAPGRPPKRWDGGQLAVHLPGTDPEEPAKLTDREILNINKKKKTSLLCSFSLTDLLFPKPYVESSLCEFFYSCFFIHIFLFALLEFLLFFFASISLILSIFDYSSSFHRYGLSCNITLALMTTMFHPFKT